MLDQFSKDAKFVFAMAEHWLVARHALIARLAMGGF